MARNDASDPIEHALGLCTMLQAELTELRFLLRRRREAREAKHNPNWSRQPRAPRGLPTGGQWVDGGGAKPGGGPKGGGAGGRRIGDNSERSRGSLQDVFPSLVTAPAGAILAPIDGFLGITGPGYAANEAATRNVRDELIAEIQAIDPNYRFESLHAGGMPSTQEGRNRLIDHLRAERAAALYNTRGEVGPLQVETLHFLQRRVDAAYSDGLRKLDAGQLDAYFSREEAVGNHIDRTVRSELRAFYNDLGVSQARGQQVRVNAREYSTRTGDRTYTIPDSRVGNVAFDVTLSPKRATSPQIRGFFRSDFNPDAVIIVRPSQLGRNHTYLITRPAEK